jgi:hypothetical protein
MKKAKRNSSIDFTVHTWAVALNIDHATIKRKLAQQEVKFTPGGRLSAKTIFNCLTAQSDKEIAITRKVNADAIARETKNAIASGQLHCKADITKAIWTECLQPLRAELLSMPQAIGPRCVNPAEAEAALHDFLESALKKINPHE